MPQNALKAFGTRIPRCKLLQGKAYHGRCASKRCWFYGFKVQVVATTDGIPVDFYVHAGAEADQTGLRTLDPATVYRYAQTYRDQGLVSYLRAEQPGYWGLLTSAQLAGLCRELDQTLYFDC